jgi:outer membrane protein
MKQFILTSILLSINLFPQSLTLEESVQMGLKNSKELAISKSKTRYAEAKIIEVGSQMFPQLKFSASYVRLSNVPPFEVVVPFSPAPIRIQDVILDNYNLKLSLQQPLFTGFRLSSLRSAAKYNFTASEYEYNAAANDYVIQILEAFWNFYNAQKIVELMKEQLVTLENHLADTKNFMDNGLATMNDVLKLEVQYSGLELKLIEAENNHDIARIIFNRIIGYDLNSQTEIIVSSVEPSIDELALDELIVESKQNRDELKSLKNRVLASDESVSAANSGWFPSVYLFANAYYNRPNQRIMPARDEFRDTWDVGVSLNWDLWNWGYTSAQTSQAEELKIQTETALSQLKEAIEIEVTREFLNYNKSFKKVEVARKSVGQAKENYRLTNEKYENQLVSSSDLIDAQTYLLEAETNLISALVNFHISKVRLEKAAGRKVY